MLAQVDGRRLTRRLFGVESVGRWRRVRLKRRAGCARSRCSGASAAKAHTSRVRAPGRACVRRQRFDQDRIPVATTSGMWPVALSKSPRSGVGSSQSPLGGTPIAWRLELGRDVSVTAAVGAGRSVDGGGAALEWRSLAWRGTKPALRFNGTLRQRPTLSTPKSLRVSRRPSAHAHLQYRPPREAHLTRPRSVPPASPSLSSRAASPYPRKRGMSPFLLGA